MNEIAAWIGILLVMFGIAVFVWGYCNSITEKANVGKPGHDGQYRIVQLENGLYEVEEYDAARAEWVDLRELEGRGQGVRRLPRRAPGNRLE